MIFAPDNDATGSTAQGGGYSNNTISGVTLGDASVKCEPNASTCSFGLLHRYMEAVRVCIGADFGLESSSIMPSEGDIRLRKPFQSTAPDADDFMCTLIDLLDMKAEHRPTMSIREFVETVAYLHSRVLPIVPQATTQPNNKAVLHMKVLIIWIRVDFRLVL